MKNRLPQFATAVAIALFSLRANAQCSLTISSNNYNPGFRANSPAVGMLADYGLIFEDAKWRECSIGVADTFGKHGAYDALIKKIDATFTASNPTHVDHFGNQVGPFQGAFEGGHVALIFASALMIGGHGDLDTALDNALIRVRQSYQYRRNGNCGFYQPRGWKDGGDTCMEEHALGAAGFAWIAAYEMKRRGPTSASYYAQQASSLIDESLSTYDSICLNDPTDPNLTTDATGRGPCNVNTNVASTLSDKLVQNSVTKMTKAYPLSFNRGQNMTYGPGQLMVLSAALVGLEEASYTKTLTTSQRLIASALLEEAQRKADPSGNYFRGGAGSPAGSGTCAWATVNGSTVVRDDDSMCSEGAVRPKIWNLTSKISQQGYSSFWERYVGHAGYPVRTAVVDRRYVNGSTSPTDTYIANPHKFDQYVNYFTKNANDIDLNWGRESFYHVLGFRWHTFDNRANASDTWYPGGDNKRPRLWAYLDNTDPGGFVDGIDSNGVAYGWACDTDLPWESIPIDFYVNGFQTFIQRAWANQRSESAVNNFCAGGTAHRFVVQLPAWTKGYPISTYALDVTWRGYTHLNAYGCAQSPNCVW